jgi:hypothetical protein
MRGRISLMRGRLTLARPCSLCEAVLLLELPVLLDKGIDAVNHLLYELDLAVAEPVLVGDVVGHTGLTARLATGSYTKQTCCTANYINKYRYRYTLKEPCTMYHDT